MEWSSVSCLWRLRLSTAVGLLCQFECRSHQAHRCMFPHFRPLVTLSTVSWFCCRSRCRLVSGWYRVSRLPLELRCPSLQTQSPWKLLSPPRQTFPVGNQDLTPPLHCPGSTSMTLYIYPRTQTGCQSSWWDTHALDIWQFHCQITLKTVCYQPYWKASVWMLLCTLYMIILQYITPQNNLITKSIKFHMCFHCIYLFIIQLFIIIIY